MKHLLSSITLLLLSTLAFGQVPNTFSSGETISSSKINANFAYVASAIKNDNITAMMVCEASGATSEDIFYFAECHSTNGQTFENSVSLRVKSIRLYPGSMVTKLQDSGTFSNGISLTNVFNNKWVLQNSIYSQSQKDTNYTIITQKHIFYKISSD